MTQSSQPPSDSFGTNAGKATAAVIGRLQIAYLDRESSALSAVATLRRGIVDDISRSPASWPYLFQALTPTEWNAGPSVDERAAHAAITLWARHQQSLRKPANLSGVSLGRGAALLSDATRQPGEDFDTGTHRRFIAVQRAETTSARLRALAQLLSMMRSQEIPLDFPRLANDLVWLESKNADVRQRALLRWARDFRRAPEKHTSSAEPTTETSQE